MSFYSSIRSDLGPRVSDFAEWRRPTSYSLPINAKGLNKPSCNAYDIKHERFSDKMLDIREQELKCREELNCFTKEKHLQASAS